MPNLIRITADTTLPEIDAALAELAIWREDSPEAEARFDALLGERFARMTGEG